MDTAPDSLKLSQSRNMGSQCCCTRSSILSGRVPQYGRCRNRWCRWYCTFCDMHVNIQKFITAGCWSLPESPIGGLVDSERISDILGEEGARCFVGECDGNEYTRRRLENASCPKYTRTHAIQVCTARGWMLVFIDRMMWIENQSASYRGRHVDCCRFAVGE
jgi:hypothetical protein